MTVIPPLATGPHQLAKRQLTVQEGTVAVVLRNGQVWQVRVPGRSGMVRGLIKQERGLPALGELSYLLFVNAPFTVEVSYPDLRLGDGRRIGVTSTLRARPVWMNDPALLLALAREYGIRSADQYTAVAAAQVDADFRAGVAFALSSLGHDAIRDSVDARHTLGRAGALSDLLKIDNLNTLFTLDGVEMALEGITREAELTRARLVVEGELAGPRRVLAEVRARHHVNLERIRALGEAENQALAAEVYQVHPWTYRHPELAQQLSMSRIESVRQLLTEYADTIPFLAETLDQTPANVLLSLMRDDVPTPGPRARVIAGEIAPSTGPAPRPWRIADLVAGAITFVPGFGGVIGAGTATTEAAGGTRLFIVGVSSDGAAEVLPSEASYWRSHGFTEVTVCVFPDRGDRVEVAQGLVVLVATECGLPPRGMTVNETGEGVVVVLELGRVSGSIDPDQATLAFDGWCRAIWDLFDRVGLRVTVELRGEDPGHA